MTTVFLVALLGVAAVGAGAGAALTAWIRARAGARLLDVPNERSSHTSPRPRGGGLAIVTVVLAGLFVYAALADMWGRLAPYALGATLIAIVSLIDDLRPLSFRVRLLVHGTAALVAIGAYTGWKGAAIPLLGEYPAVGAILSFVWIVGLTNAYNFMDGIDGLAGMQAVIAGAAWCGIALLVGHTAPALVALLSAAASAGFLIHNWPPARIFMGDVGSAFLGYTFAALPLMVEPGRPTIILAGVVAMGVFVFDTAFTFMRRLMAGENVFHAHRSHLYQRLTGAGLTHRTVTLLYALLATLLAGAAFLIALAPRYALPVWIMAAVFVSAVLWLTVYRQERRSHAGRPLVQS